MKRIYLLLNLLFALFLHDIQAQAPHWIWAKGITSQITGTNFITGLYTDMQGNSYVAGEFNDSTVTFGNITIVCSIDHEEILIKYDSSGNVIWAKSMPHMGAFSVSGDHNGNVYVMGSFVDTVVFAGDTFIYTCNQNAFLAKYNSSGQEIWFRCGTNTAQCTDATVYNIAIDPNGYIYAHGVFEGDSISFGSYKITSLSDEQPPDIFIVKYDSLGNVIWVRSGGGGQNWDWDIGTISTDLNGNVYIVGGSVDSIVVFGSDTVYSPLPNYSNIYFVKYDSSGNLIWLKGTGIGPWYYVGATNLSSDANGNIYMAGDFSSASIQFGADTLFNNGTGNFFLIKYDSSGNIIWAKSEGGKGDVTLLSMLVDNKGAICIAGTYGGDSCIVAMNVLRGTDSAYTNFFIAKYDSSGNGQWAIADSGADNYTNSMNIEIGVDTFNNIYVAGLSNSPDLIFGNASLNCTDNRSIFVAKLGYGLEQPNGIYNTKGPDTKITVYPNPSNGTFYFNGVSDGNTINVYDIMGQQVFEVSASQNNYPVNLSSKSKGIYFYKVTDQNNNIQQGKIVVE